MKKETVREGSRRRIGEKNILKDIPLSEKSKKIYLILRNKRSKSKPFRTNCSIQMYIVSNRRYQCTVFVRILRIYVCRDYLKLLSRNDYRNGNFPCFTIRRNLVAQTIITVQSRVINPSID